MHDRQLEWILFLENSKPMSPNSSFLITCPYVPKYIIVFAVFSIWNHLVHLSKERGTTVLITTHYIDEAKESTAVGVMRYGRLLVEQDPSQLLQSFNTTSLEAVVLQLCKNDESDSNKKEKGEVDVTRSNDLAKLEYDVQTPDDTKCKLVHIVLYRKSHNYYIEVIFNKRNNLLKFSRSTC